MKIAERERENAPASSRRGEEGLQDGDQEEGQEAGTRTGAGTGLRRGRHVQAEEEVVRDPEKVPPAQGGGAAGLCRHEAEKGRDDQEGFR